MSDVIERLNAALEGRYAIERELGQGGMATVYLARDVRHDRSVAIKVLKPELAAVIGAERFLAEIRTTANLQHPHILALFDSGDADGFLFYVMPFVDGETLRDRLDREKQLPVEDAIAIASAVAGALDYAHRHDVIHRDIKPANILIHDGQPVVADFGIALAVSNAGGGRLTETGLSLGTPHYMSPEQASADRDLTAQSDVYALASVTYEMLTGTPPFSAPTAQAVLMQILTEEAKPVTTLRKSVPPHVESAIDRALEKLPADRFTSAEGFARALGDPSATEERRAVRSAAAQRPGWQRVAWPAIALLMTGVAAWSWMVRPNETTGPVLRMGLLEEGLPTLGSTGAGTVAISRDGNQVALIHSGADGRAALSVRPFDSFGRRLIASAEVIGSVAFSPDGDALVFHDGESIRTISLEPGDQASQVLAPSFDLTNLRGVHWDPDGYVYFQDTDYNLLRIPAAGGSPETLWRPADGRILAPNAVLPGQEAALVEISAGRFNGAIAVGVLEFETGRLDTLTVGAFPRLVDEFVIWMDLESETLYGQRFDVATRRLTGPARALLDGVYTSRYAWLFDISSTGTLVHQVLARADENLISVSRTGERTETGLRVPSGLGLRLSPDGTRVVFETQSGDGSDIYVLDLSSGTRNRITFQQTAYYPAWSTDGTRVAYYNIVDGVYDLYWKNADGTGIEESLLASPSNEIEVVFLPGGEQIVVRQGDRGRADVSDIYVYDVGDPDSGRPITAGEGNAVSPMVSPDGRYIAYASDELGVAHVFVRSIENPDELHQISDVPSGEPYWSPDGTELFFRTTTRLVVAPISLESGFSRLGPAVDLFDVSDLLGNPNHTSYAVLPDGETFLFMKNPRVVETRVVINWMDEVRERMAQ
jgi:serine/threonine-protein kinase